MNKLLQKIGEMWCWLTTRHDYLAIYSGRVRFLRCSHCGHTTPGWTMEPKPLLSLSSKDIEDIRQDLECMELQLLGGG